MYPQIIIYGNNNSPAAKSVYRRVLHSAEKLFPKFKFSIATPETISQDLQKKNLKKIIPLLLIKGREYSLLEETISKAKIPPATLTPPILENKSIQKLLLQGSPKKTIFLAHGSNDKTIQAQYRSFELIAKNYGDFKFCYFLGTPNFKELLTDTLLHEQRALIKPLMFIKGKHLRIDLEEDFLHHRKQQDWTLQPCLGHDELFIEKMLVELI